MKLFQWVLSFQFILIVVQRISAIDPLLSTALNDQSNYNCSISLKSDRSSYIVNDKVSITVTVGPHNQLLTLTLMCDNAEDRCIRVLGCNSCGNFTFRPSTLNESQMIVLDTKAASNLVLYINYSASQPVSESILRLSIGRSNVINTLAQIIGWIYFFAWSISFYPQIWLNFTRQNVSGLSFDFLALNITGFLFYGIYNVALYFGASFQSEYFASHPFSQIPVEINDVVFAVHACFATIATVIQCFIYERDGQRVSLTAKSMVAVFWAGAGISLICTSIGKIAALTFISLLSYIKLLITLTKYVPQAFLNYRRKSTIGWSIGNVLLDFTGGVFSILQIILLNYNFDDWYNITGNLSKFGLGLFSILFDFLFIVQHYVLYTNTDTVLLETSQSSTCDSTNNGSGIENPTLKENPSEQISVHISDTH